MSRVSNHSNRNRPINQKPMDAPRACKSKPVRIRSKKSIERRRRHAPKRKSTRPTHHRRSPAAAPASGQCKQAETRTRSGGDNFSACRLPDSRHTINIQLAHRRTKVKTCHCQQGYAALSQRHHGILTCCHQNSSRNRQIAAASNI